MIKNRLISVSFALLITVNYGCASSVDFISHNTTNDLIANKTDTLHGNGSPKLLSRRKRYIAFPEGSSFSVGINRMAIVIII